MTYEEVWKYFLERTAQAENEKIRQRGEMVVKALENQIENERAIFTHICKSDNDRYPTEFSIYARVISQDDESVTIDRFQKFGALSVGKVTISKKDFERYYKEIQL